MRVFDLYEYMLTRKEKGGASCFFLSILSVFSCRPPSLLSPHGLLATLNRRLRSLMQPIPHKVAEWLRIIARLNPLESGLRAL